MTAFWLEFIAFPLKEFWLEVLTIMAFPLTAFQLEFIAFPLTAFCSEVLTIMAFP